MWTKLPGYFFLAFGSFCLFFAIFHTVVNAQVLPVAVTPTQSNEIPTPTMFSEQPTPVVKNGEFPSANSQQSQPNPLPIREAAVAVSPTTAQPSATPTPLPTSIPSPSPTILPQPTIAVVTDTESLFTQFADEYHVDKEMLKKIARCESGFNTNSNNSGMYLGMFQFAAQTWISTRASMGLDTNTDLRMNAEEAIRTAAYKIANGGINSWPNCH